MPFIFALYKKYRELIKDMAVIRLHGSDRQGIEKVTGKDWSQIVAPTKGSSLSLFFLLLM